MRAMICDDDEIIRKGLCTVVDWSGLGVEIVGTAGDGKEGLILLKEQKPDLLLTDIRMPQVDGLELIQEGKKQNPDLMVIVFSGYDDFAYVRRALRLGVQDYLMKPINMEELILQVTACASQFRRVAQESFEEMENFLRNWLVYGDSVNDRIQKLERECCQVLILETEKNGIYFRYLAEEFRKQKIYVLFQKERRCELVIMGKSELQVEVLGNKCIELAERYFQKEKTALVTAASSIGSQIYSLRRCYNEAQNALKLKYIKGYNQNLTYQDMQQYQKAEKVEGERFAAISNKELILAVKQGDLKKTEEQLKRLQRSMLDLGMDSYLYMQFMVGSLYHEILRELDTIGIRVELVFENPIDEYRRLIECDTMEKAAEVLNENVRRICEYVYTQQSGAYSNSVYKALQYIGKHYSEPSLGLEEVAEEAGLSTGRFSTLFKTETAMTFTDYLLRLRMEKAKELMKNPNMKIYEAAQFAGYENIPYFSTAFKKYTGVSPSEYRAKQKNE